MVEVRKSRQRRSGTTYPFDEKCRVRAINKQGRDGEEGGNEGWIGKGSTERDSQHESASDSRELSNGETVKSLALTDMASSFSSSESVGVGEILEREKEWDVDEEMRSDDEVSLGDSFKVMENPQHILDGGSSSEPEKVRWPSEIVELTGEPESNRAEQALDDTITLDLCSQNSSEEPPGCKFLRGKKQTGQRESLNESLPPSLLIPAHARAKSNRRSLQCIPPLLERKAKLPLGPADSPRD
ncbi:hypothetical protein PEBR_31776 [Penicillium brasilianum]|uniref:Uncharacterized protein n=1 Tax=Penicillium brasilianum TaxID=104259 RepID=A0A1S9RF14_PENBI|nr:hypothetical protein PEBR_31776 [Penicillium brasilianum]